MSSCNHYLKEGRDDTRRCGYLFNSVAPPNFTYGVTVDGASDSDLSTIQNFLDRCFKEIILRLN